MNMDITWMKEAGLDTQAGISYTGNTEKYVSAVQRFYKNHEKNRAKVEEYFAAKDYENFMITVHALKSNAKMIGATNLSAQFESLENAAREQDTAVIEELTPQALNDYDELIEKLKPVGEMGDVKAADEIPADIARTTVERLLAALDDFDDEEAKKLAKVLSGYPFRLTQAEKLKDAVAFIEDFMYDEAAEIIRQIAMTIE
jgi:HPt (histidine-containing phosphotransfer) domain-containing protein